jgi:hypothetical protein
MRPMHLAVIKRGQCSLRAVRYTHMFRSILKSIHPTNRRMIILIINIAISVTHFMAIRLGDYGGVA